MCLAKYTLRRYQIQMRAHKKLQGFDQKIRSMSVTYLTAIGMIRVRGWSISGTNVRPDQGAAPAAVSSASLVKSLNEKRTNRTPRPQYPGRILAPCRLVYQTLLWRDQQVKTLLQSPRWNVGEYPVSILHEVSDGHSALASCKNLRSLKNLSPRKALGGEECTDADPKGAAPSSTLRSRRVKGAA